jgi:hypothetical protein
MLKLTTTTLSRHRHYRPPPKKKSSDKRRRKKRGFVVNNFTPPPLTRQKEDYKSFYLRKSTWEAIRTSRGWYGRGATVRFAEALGVTRQYAWDIITQRCGCSSNVMRKIIALLGMDRPIVIKGQDHYQCWCVLFEMVCQREANPNHPIYNQMKYAGEVPYSKYSESANLRKRDYDTEKVDDG